MLPYAFGLVQIEVAEPEPGKGEHGSALELDDGRVNLVRPPPLRKPQHAPRDDEMHHAHDVPEVQRDDLAAPPHVL